MGEAQLPVTCLTLVHWSQSQTAEWVILTWVIVEGQSLELWAS